MITAKGNVNLEACVFSMHKLGCEVKKLLFTSNLKISLYKLEVYSRKLVLSNYHAINTWFSEFVLLNIL